MRKLQRLTILLWSVAGAACDQSGGDVDKGGATCEATGVTKSLEYEVRPGLPISDLVAQIEQGISPMVVWGVSDQSANGISTNVPDGTETTMMLELTHRGGDIVFFDSSTEAAQCLGHDVVSIDVAFSVTTAGGQLNETGTGLAGFAFQPGSDLSTGTFVAELAQPLGGSLRVETSREGVTLKTMNLSTTLQGDRSEGEVSILYDAMPPATSDDVIGGGTASLVTWHP